MSRADRVERVLAVFRAAPLAHHYGYETGRLARVRPFWLYSILDELVDKGLVTSGWDESERDPRRRFYMLTDRGREHVS